MNIKTSVIELTPAKARQFLKRNKSNRKLRKGPIKRYARDMVAGRWHIGEGLMFDTNDNMINGQHRCLAVIEANVTVPMTVMTGMPRKAATVIDQAVSRNTADSAHFYGVTGVTNESAATARTMRVGMASREAVTRQEELDFFKKYRAEINFIDDNMPATTRLKGVNVAPTRAVVGRAHFNHRYGKLKKLQQFCRVLLTGMKETDADNIVIKLRDKLVRANYEKTSHRSVIYKWTVSVLYSYLMGEALASIKPCAEEMFPMPHDYKEVIAAKEAKKGKK